MWSKSCSLGLLIGTLSLCAAVPAVSNVAQSLPLYDPSRSSSSNLMQAKPLKVHYADADTELSGYECKDDVGIGSYKARMSFACWTQTPNAQFWAQMGNGVLGLGPKAQKQHDKDGHVLPPPMMEQLTGPSAQDSNAKGMPDKVSLMATSAAAELQIGGYVPQSVQGKMRMVQSVSAKSYTLSINSIRIGESFDNSVELLAFDPKLEHRHVPAIIDSGSPCIMLPNNDETGKLLKSPYKLYQNHPSDWNKMFITVNGLDIGLELNRHQLEVEHHTFLDQAWGTSVRPCVMPVTWAMQPPHMTPIVLGSVFFRAYNVMFDLSKATAKIPPMIGIGKINPKYDVIGISDYNMDTAGEDGGRVHRVFVQHKKPKLFSKPDQVAVANPNGHQFIAQVSIGEPAQHMRVVVDTGSPLLGLFVAPESLGKYYQGSSQGLSHRRPAPLNGYTAKAIQQTRDQAKQKLSSIVRANRRRSAVSPINFFPFLPPCRRAALRIVPTSLTLQVPQQIKIVPFVGVVVLVLLLLFLRNRRAIMLQIYYATKPDMPYR